MNVVQMETAHDRPWQRDLTLPEIRIVFDWLNMAHPSRFYLNLFVTDDSRIVVVTMPDCKLVESPLRDVIGRD